MKCYQHQKLNFFFPPVKKSLFKFSESFNIMFCNLFYFYCRFFVRKIQIYENRGKFVRRFSDLMFMKLKLGFSCTGGSECCKLSG